MGRKESNRDFSNILQAARGWIDSCLVHDGSLFGPQQLWTQELVTAVYDGFAGNPDFSHDDFVTKLTGQMRHLGDDARQLMGEVLWALLLFPSNITPQRKRKQILA